MTEYGYVEEAMLEWLAGKDDDPNDHGLGWAYRSEDDMEVYGRDLTDPIVEALLIPAIMCINRAVDTEAKARKVVDALRNVMRAPDPLDANRRTLEVLRDGVSLVLESGQDATTVKFIEFDPDRQHLNDFTVTNQYRLRGSETVKAATVLLVNGIPVVLAECKSYVNSGHDWAEAVNPLRRGQHLPPGWATTAGGRQKVSLALLVASWMPGVIEFGLCPEGEAEPPFLAAAVEELARTTA